MIHAVCANGETGVNHLFDLRTTQVRPVLCQVCPKVHLCHRRKVLQMRSAPVADSCEGAIDRFTEKVVVAKVLPNGLVKSCVTALGYRLPQQVGLPAVMQIPVVYKTTAQEKRGGYPVLFQDGNLVIIIDPQIVVEGDDN